MHRLSGNNSQTVTVQEILSMLLKIKNKAQILQQKIHVLFHPKQ